MATVSTLTIRSLDEMSEIRAFPQIANQIMVACGDPKTTGQGLCELIQHDASVSLRVLRIANSSVYGLSGNVRTLNHAVVILGFRALRSLAISAATSDMFSSGTAVEAQGQLWRHCMGTAVIAKLLAMHVPRVSPEDAFLAGVVHDIGKLVYFDVDADEYLRLVKTNTGPIEVFEKAVFGFDHQEIGLHCADAWGLPLDISEAIGFHHCPQDAYHAPELVSLVRLASDLCGKWGLNMTPAIPESVHDLVAACHLEIDSELVDAQQTEAVEAFGQLQAAFA